MIFYFLQSVILGFVQPDRELFLISNYISLLFLFQYNIYVSRSLKTLSFMTLLKSIRKTYIMEKNCQKMMRKRKRFSKFLSVSRLLDLSKFIAHSYLVRGVIPTFLHQPPPPPFSKIPTFLEIQDVPTFHRPIRKTKAPNNS